MHQLFTTLVYQEKLRVSLADFQDEIRRISEVDQAGRDWSRKNYRNGYTSYGSWDRMHQMSSTFEKLQKKIDPHVLKFVKKLGFDLPAKSLQMDSCWVNLMPSGAAHTGHIHPHSVISGTFYVDVPKGASALKFEDPRLGLFMNAPGVKKMAPKNQQRFFALSPKAGDLVLFESWLKHEVPVNTSKSPRISVSFNYGWK